MSPTLQVRRRLYSLPPSRKFSARPNTFFRCSMTMATGARSSPPIPRSNRITFCCSSGCIAGPGETAGVWNPPDRGRIQRAAERILSKQLPDGGFNIYVKGPSEISASVKAYFALKVAGIPVEDERMTRLRDRIVALGGIQAANSYTKVNLSLFDLYPRDGTPSIPPEIMLLPGKLLYQMSSWTRAIIVALAIVHAHDPKRPVPAGFNLDEIFIPGKSTSFESNDSWLSWRKTFVQSDKILKLWDRYGFARIREAAIRKCEHWMLERMKHADGLGAIYPPMQYAIMALDVLGYPANYPVRMEAVRQFENLIVDDGKTFFFQPCFSPVWDTAIAAYALGEAGFSRNSRAVATRPIGCSPARFAAMATGPSSAPGSSPPAGPSSSITTGIPTSTIPPW